MSYAARALTDDSHRASLTRLAVVGSVWAALVAVAIASGQLGTAVLADDAFYYFEIARNAALGEGFTFDSIEPTNGFHPLWAWALVPLYAAIPDDPWLPIRLAQLAGALCTLATAFAVHRLFSDARDPAAGEFAAYVLLLNPFSAVLSLRGMETPLATLLVVLSCLQLARLRARSTYSVRETFALGATLGCCALARTDAVLWAGIVAAFVLRDLLAARRARDLPTRGGAGLAGAVLVVSPWLIWNLSTFGTIVQSSARAKMRFDLWGELPTPGAGQEGIIATAFAIVGDGLMNLWWIALHNAAFIAGEELESVSRLGIRIVWLALLYAGVIVAASIWARARLRRSESNEAPDRTVAGPLPFAAPLLTLGVAHFVWYGWIMHSYSSWYFLLPVSIAAIFHGVLYQRIREAFGARSAQLGMLAPLLAIAAVATWAELKAAEPQVHERLTQRVEWIGHELPPNSTAGAWNTGGFGYLASFHAPHLRIINLDGVVNNRVSRLEGPEAHRDYLVSEVDYLIETPQYLARTMDPDSAEKIAREIVIQVDTVPLWKIRSR